MDQKGASELVQKNSKKGVNALANIKGPSQVLSERCALFSTEENHAFLSFDEIVRFLRLTKGTN